MKRDSLSTVIALGVLGVVVYLMWNRKGSVQIESVELDSVVYNPVDSTVKLIPKAPIGPPE